MQNLLLLNNEIVDIDIIIGRARELLVCEAKTKIALIARTRF